MVKKSIHFDTQLNFKCSTEDKRLIQDKAKEIGKDVSDYIRSVAINKVIESRTDIQTVVQIRRIGSNVNQIARKVNSSSEIKNPEELLLKLKLIHEELEQMKAILNVNNR